MTINPDEIKRRRTAAFDAIRHVLGTAADEHGAKLFISHHLDEIADEFWLKHCGVVRPSATQILEILVLRSHWSEHDDEGIDTFDFTLPNNVTDYVICVEFDDRGDVSGVSMAS